MPVVKPSPVAIALLATSLFSVRAQETEEAKSRIEAPSPDGRFAFRYSSESDSDEDTKTYSLIAKQTGKVLAKVAESDPDMGPSARFSMSVLWRSDSNAFAVTATLWKRGSGVLVYLRNGDAFREVKLPELDADIPEKIKKGKSFPHINQLNAQSATRWQKDGSLIMDIETIEDGNEGSVTAKRTVILSFDSPGKAKLLKSTVKYTLESP